MNYAIRAAELSKTYRIYKRPIDRFFELFTARRRHIEFPALEELSFEIGRGETVGLIGKNGAGKSTLLKLLAGVAKPTTGVLDTRGTVASILELGTGFHPEFTGRDNAALNASILGVPPADLDRKLPLILDFSELGEFLNRPVKTYSSGMYMRLAFSVAVNVDPDILIIDEALAVGDGHFQKKCIDKIREFQQREKTIIFCSHALYYITTLCGRALWLDRGAVKRFGPSVDVVHEYETFLLEEEKAQEAASPVEAEPSDSPVQIRSIDVFDSNGNPATEFDSGDPIEVRVRITSAIPSAPIHVLFGVLRAADEMRCFAMGTRDDGLPPLSGRSEYDVSIRLHTVPLTRGDYGVVIFVGDEAAMHVYDRKDIRPAFSIRGDRYEIGLMKIDHTWSHEPVAKRLVR